MSKLCNSCKENLPLENFRVMKIKTHICKECERIYFRTPVRCECGKDSTKQNIAKHRKTKSHFLKVLRPEP